MQPFYTTASGRLYLGDAFSVLQCLIREGVRAKLVVTSPPFPLVTKKSYGNVDQEQ